MASEIKIPYTGQAFTNYKRLTSDLKYYCTNVLNKHEEPDISPIYYYISTKNYIHVLRAIRNPYKKGHFQVCDFILTKNSTFKDNGTFVGDFVSLDDIVLKLESMLNKNLKDW